MQRFKIRGNGHKMDESHDDVQSADGRSIIQLSEITKTYTMGDMSLTVLKGIDLEVRDGEFLAILGFSGTGKT
ncbi:MAG: hypothetical protein AAFV33_04305, partial [Chloroflexota bacterium]